MIFYSLKTRILKPNFNLLAEITTVLKQNKLGFLNEDILILSSKAVALSQGRIVDLRTIKPSKKAKSLNKTRYGANKEDPRIVDLAIKESQAVMPGEMLLTLTNNALIPAAGIDLSNAPEGYAVLLPKDPWITAQLLLTEFKKIFKIKNAGVVITDSHCQPLRRGTTGLAIAWAGFLGVEDSRGQKDIYGKKLKFTSKAVADNIASAANILMGEAAEKIPFVLARGLPIKFTTKLQTGKNVFLHPRKCLFGGIYNKETIASLKGKM